VRVIRRRAGARRSRRPAVPVRPPREPPRPAVARHCRVLPSWRGKGPSTLCQLSAAPGSDPSRLHGATRLRRESQRGNAINSDHQLPQKLPLLLPPPPDPAGPSSVLWLQQRPLACASQGGDLAGLRKMGCNAVGRPAGEGMAQSSAALAPPIKALPGWCWLEGTRNCIICTCVRTVMCA
jgi:hypothetical protein